MRRAALAFFFSACTLCIVAFSQTSLASKDKHDSLAQLFNTSISKLTSPALDERKRVRRNIQRLGYSNVLMDVLRADGLSAMFSYFKVTWHIDYSMSHRPFIVQIPIVGGQGRTFDVPLQDDWTFPADPWKKD